MPNSPSLRYFAATGHTVRGKVLSFWQANGGVAVFGRPLSELYTAQNSDGSGRSYQMQFFENARIELHPEYSNPRYSVLLGALGEDRRRPRCFTTD
mgnify:CR=1 FL=1